VHAAHRRRRLPGRPDLELFAQQLARIHTRGGLQSLPALRVGQLQLSHAALPTVLLGQLEVEELFLGAVFPGALQGHAAHAARVIAEDHVVRAHVQDGIKGDAALVVVAVVLGDPEDTARGVEVVLHDGSW